MGFNTGPIWVSHMGPIWVLQPGYIWDPYGLVHMSSIWVLYGSSHIYLSEKNNKKKQNKATFTHFLQSQTIGWTGKVPTERDLHVQVIARLKVIAHAYNEDALKIQASFLITGKGGFMHIYIPINFKGNGDIRVNIKI